ncbi:class II aldolase/adducin family protein, partial [Streptomyces sp. MBT57]|nr:class II aldolase/adducin family protein [Streptomyces sp. MBT57]
EQLHFSMPPVHASPDEERAYRRQRLAGALRLFGEYGYEDGVSGHVTVRDPELADCYWVNPFGAPFAGIAPQDLILVNGDGQVVQGRFHVNQAAFAVHAAVHRARPGAVAVAHTHSVHGRV